jgi:hypothetical protein
MRKEKFFYSGGKTEMELETKKTLGERRGRVRIITRSSYQSKWRESLQNKHKQRRKENQKQKPKIKTKKLVRGKEGERERELFTQ